MMRTDTKNSLWSIYASSSAASASAKAALGVILDTLIAPYIPQSDLTSFKHENMLANKWEQMREVGANHFVVSPNPATQQFSIACSLASSTFIEIKCYDQSGKLVFEKRSEGKQLNIPIDCQGWQNGTYLIKGIDGNNQRYFAKVTVQH